MLSRGASPCAGCCCSPWAFLETLSAATAIIYTVRMLPTLSVLCGLPDLLRRKKCSQAGFCRACSLAALRVSMLLVIPGFGLPPSAEVTETKA